MHANSPAASRIGIVGGVERIAPALRSIAAERGAELEFHPGHTGSGASARLRALVERVDLVVLVTEVNSHAAVWQTRELARRAGRPCRIVRKFGTSQLRALLAA